MVKIGATLYACRIDAIPIKIEHDGRDARGLRSMKMFPRLAQPAGERRRSRIALPARVAIVATAATPWTGGVGVGVAIHVFQENIEVTLPKIRQRDPPAIDEQIAA